MPMGDQEDKTLTVDDVAALFRAGKWLVYWVAANGTLPTFKVGRTRRFRRTDLNASMEGKIVLGGSMAAQGADGQ